MGVIYENNRKQRTASYDDPEALLRIFPERTESPEEYVKQQNAKNTTTYQRGPAWNWTDEEPDQPVDEEPRAASVPRAYACLFATREKASKDPLPGTNDRSSIDLEWDEIEYQHGDRMSYIRKDLTGTLRNKEERINRTSNEIPEWDIVLGKDRTFDPLETYPVIGREELKAIMDWLSSLVEYEEGGKHFQIYKANDGNIEVALVYDEYEPSLAPPVGTVIMKLKGRTKVPVEEGPDQRSPGIERNTRVQSPECNQPQPLETTDEEDNYQEMRREEETGNLPKERTLPKIEPSNPKPTHACLHIGLDDNESRVDHQAGDDPLRDPGTLTPDDDEEDDDGPTTHMGLGRGIHQNLPGPFDIKFLPAPDIPSNGLLAARQLVPIAQYGETEEYEFYAKGVTLVLDDEDENPKYYRGNALVRISNEGIQEARPPARARVNRMREKLFRMGRYAVPKVGTNEEQPNKDPEGSLQMDTLAGTLEMTGSELTAVLEDLMDNPIEQIKEKRTYEIFKNPNGLVLVTRVPFDEQEWTNENELAEEGNLKEERREEEDRENSSQRRLTQLGNAPLPPDRDPAQKHEVREIHGGNWCGIPWDPRDGAGSSQPWWDEPNDLKITPTESSQPQEIIKQTGLTHQEESFRNPSSPPLSPKSVPPPSASCLIFLMGPPLVSSRPLPRQMSSAAAVCSVDPLPPQFGPPSARSEQVGEDEVYIPTPPTVLRPGILTASHFVLVNDRESTPRDPSYFAYGARTVIESEQGEFQEYDGHAMVHMYPFATPLTLNFPRPPLRERMEAARAALLAAPSRSNRSPGLDSVGRVPRFTDPLPPFPILRLTPEDQRAGNRLGSSSVAVGDDPLRLHEVNEMPVKSSTTERTVAVPEKEKEDQRAAIGEVPSGLSREKKETYRASGFVLEDSKNVPERRGVIRAEPTTHVGPKDDPISRSATFHQPSKSRVDDQRMDTTDDKTTHLPNDEPEDVEMQVITLDDEESDSAPDLETVSSTNSDDDDYADARATDRIATEPLSPNKPSAVSQSGSVAVVDKAPEVGPTSLEAKAHFLLWKQNINRLKLCLEEGVWWSNTDARQILWNLGLTPWWFDIMKERKRRRYPKWEEWWKRLVREWRRRFPTFAADEFRLVSATGKLEAEPDDEPEDKEMLWVQLGEVAKIDEDVEMEEDDTPAKPPPTPEPLKVFYTPKSPPAGFIPPPPPEPENEEIADLRSRISELENQFANAEDDARRNLDSLREQLFTDGITLTNLKWRLADIDGKKKKKGKRAYRKARGQAPSHRYPTRYATSAQFDEVVEVRRREYDALEERIRRTETKQERMKEEIGRLETDLAHADELARKIPVLTASLEEFKNAQLKVNLGIIQELVKLKSTYADVLEKRTTTHSNDLAVLTARFNVLQTIATSVLTSRLPPPPASIPPPYKPYHIPGYPLPVQPPSRVASPMPLQNHASRRFHQI